MKIHIRFFLCALVCALCMVSNIYAIPTNPRSFVVTQKDGTKIELRFIGDENFSYYCTMDGVPAVKVGDSYYYANISDDGKLTSTGMLLHEKGLRNIAEHEFVNTQSGMVTKRIKEVWSKRLKMRNEQLMTKVNERKARRKAFGHPTTYIGKKKGIVILVNYADFDMLPTSSRDAWYAQFNEHGYKKNSHRGSVRDYFLDQSYQQLDIEFDVVGPYTVSQGWEYYGKQNSWGADMHPCQLVTEACKLANADVNFKDYDWDGDGEVEQVFVVFAGYSAASGYSENAIWPHEWHLAYGQGGGDGQGSIILDGVKIDNYALSSELKGKSGTIMDPIGTAVHEFSHCLGLPDFYDVDSKGTQCMDYWDVLDAGCYSGPNWDGSVPTGYTAYERHFAGWLEYEELTLPRNVTNLENLGDTPKALIYYNKGNKNEYFILENRQSKGWFKYPDNCHGLIIYHVDYDKNLWEIDRPNSDPNHPRMVFVPADKSFTRDYVSQMSSDFFPGTNRVTSLTNTSHEACYGKMFNKNSDGTYHTNMELKAITEVSGKISFIFNGGEAVMKSKLSKLIDEVNAMIDVPHSDEEEGATQLLQAAVRNAQDVLTNSTSSAEYQDATDTLRQKAIDFLYVANPTDSLQPFDITFAFINPEVSSNEGWKDELANNGYNYENNCGEYTNMRFTLAQSSTHKLPKGTYTATCQAFQRAGTIEESADNTVTTNFYARTKSIKIKNVTDEAQESRVSIYDKQLADKRYIPADTKSANKFFNAGYYTNSIDFNTINNSGTSVKIGLRCGIAKENHWTCFSNFKLYFRGNPEVTDITNTNANTSMSNDVYDLSGRKLTDVQSLSNGIYIIGGKKVVIKK